jgi:hypothetical protein
MQNQTPIIERAFQLARSGEYQNWVEVSSRLRGEGYMNVDSHFGGTMLKKQIGTACKDAVKSKLAA